MSGDAMARAVQQAAARAASRAKSLYLGTVVSLVPLQVELHDSATVLDEDANLELSQWIKFYRDTTGLALNDVVLVDRVEDAWVVTDVESDEDPLIPGSTGGDLSFAFHQSVAATVWSVDHNLSKFPAIQVFDGAGQQIEPDITHINNQSAMLTFSQATSGWAYCN